MRRVTKELLDAPNQTPMNKSLLRTSIACAAFLILLVLQASPAGAQVSVGPQNTTGTVGDTVSVAVEAGDLSQSNVASYQFRATYDDSVIEVIGVETENTLTSGDPEVNTDNAGEARVAFASDEVLGGPGTLIELRTVLSSAGSTTISLEEARFFNRDGQEVTEDINVTSGVVESSVAVTAPDLRVLRTTDSLEIPVRVGDLTGAEVTSYQFTLAYDPDVIDITDAITEGTMSEEEELQFNKTAPDTVKVSFASSGDPLEGPGTLLRFQASTEGVGSSPLDVEEFVLGGSDVPTTVTDGSVTVTEVAQAQFIHNAADPAAEAVDVYFDEERVLDDFEFRSATQYLDVPADVEIDVGVAPASSESADDVIASFPLTFAVDQSHTVVANGVLSPGDFAANPDGEDIGFRFFVDDSAREEASSADSVDLRAVHGATDAPTVDIETNGTTLFSDVTYGDVSGYISSEPTALRLLVTPGNSDDVVAAFQADLSGLGGQSATVLASGFLDPSANQDGPGFRLVAALADGTVVVFDLNQPPEFTAVPGGQMVQPTETVEAQVEAEDPDGDPVSFSLTQGPDGASIDSTSGQFTFTPAVSQAGNTFTIGVQASDGAATADTSFAVTVGEIDRSPISVNIDQSFGDATEDTNYRLVGLPGQVDLPVEETLSGEPGEFNEWRVFWDDGSAETQDGLVEFDGTSQFNFQDGRGFWMLSRNNWTVSQEFDPVPLDDAGNASIPLHDGWNIISNPLGKDISWSSVQAVNDVSQPLWSFTDSFDQSSSFSSAQSGQAYYFLNDGGLDELLIPFFESSGSEAAVASKKKEGEILRLDALVDGDKASSVWVGTQPGAKEGRDEFDGFSPPGYFTEATLSAGNENIESKHSLAVDIRPSEAEGHTYDLAFETESEGRMTLQASGLSDLATEKQVRLYNKQNGRSLDLRSTPTADVEVSSGEAEFALLIGTSSYVEEAKSDLVPDELSLRQYPNPFQAQGQTTIEYSLPEQTEVSVKVYDVLGRRVRTLVSGETQRSGVHTLQWNARDKQGQAVASGVYFARLDAGQTRSIKMVVVK
jgi:hypothetical protein